ncbi:MAG: tetratricopeptide repeat protein [Deltaproteobacteria bacterium]|nr:tetratricopeptide repeat protein [Deltaproteobacteria bacterium]
MPTSRLFPVVTTLLAAAALSACTPDGEVSIAQAVSAEAAADIPDLAASLVEPAPEEEVDEALRPIGEPGTPLAREAIPHHDPRFHDHFAEGQLLMEEGDATGAIDHLRKALFDAPESAATWYELGQAYVTVGRRGRGVDCMEEAVAREPRHVEAQRFLARHFLNRGETAAARAPVRALARYDREDFRTPYLQSRLFLAMNMWQEAITASRRAVALNPEFIYAYNNLGFAALQVGRDALAIQYLEAATELTPLEPYMLNNLGVAYERLLRHGDSLTAFARAASLDPMYVKAVSNRDRMQAVVDRETADEVARILAARATGEAPDEGVASMQLP